MINLLLIINQHGILDINPIINFANSNIDIFCPVAMLTILESEEPESADCKLARITSSTKTKSLVEGILPSVRVIL